MIIWAPISIGELYDKLSILEIKLARIHDSRQRGKIRAELDRLRRLEALVEDRARISLLLPELQRINRALWDIENGKRAMEKAGDFGPEFIDLARDGYIKKDERAAIRRAINLLVGSEIVEEKRYG